MRDVPEALRRLIDDSLETQPRVTVAVDGPCGGGKSTLGEALRRAYANAGSELFHMDDFFLPPDMRTPERLSAPGGNVHRERFLEEVLIPLSSCEPFTYRKYDCQSGQYIPADARPGRVCVIEGAYSLHPALRNHYDIKVFLDIGAQAQLDRLRGRVGPQKLERFIREWIPLENRYFDALGVREAADIVLFAEETQ